MQTDYSASCDLVFTVTQCLCLQPCSTVTGSAITKPCLLLSPSGLKQAKLLFFSLKGIRLIACKQPANTKQQISAMMLQSVSVWASGRAAGHTVCWGGQQQHEALHSVQQNFISPSWFSRQNCEYHGELEGQINSLQLPNTEQQISALTLKTMKVQNSQIQTVIYLIKD